ncbi:calcium-binding protein 39-like [Histomonas meleagridis]|uniref:calcium-binding protein 39-like n=1 Tax=Histomonas meleagridis TaxID=135588 RepID=UPI003559A60E|nr:calcium-binding protein 39-like [Histomonas meleagridis]KAH0797312.1 calcium-binding protein 39-like [Histomonas meleagridis]
MEGDEASARALQLVVEITHTKFITLGLKCMILLPVEERKQFTIIFTGSITQQTGSEYPLVDWIQKNPKTLQILIDFYRHPELAVCAGEMLRLCVKHKVLASQLLTKESLDTLFSFFSVSHFDVSADSFATFRELILKAPQAKDFLQNNSQNIIDRLHNSLDETNYAACRQSLKLIGEIISEYESFRNAYLSNEQNLIKIMKLMSSSYHNISLEAFHVFKLFVVYEHKPETVLKILRANADKLIEYIHELVQNNPDQELENEKEHLIVQIQTIKMR